MDYGSGLTLTTAKYYTPSGRLIQRDYSNQSFYDYYTRGGLSRDEKEAEAKPAGPAGPESHTDTGRAVYGGGGITPDDVVKPRTISQQQARVLNPIFFFTRDLVNGRIPGLDKYKYQGASDYQHSLKPEDFPVTDAVYQAFKTYVTRDPSWKLSAAQLDGNRQVIETQLRFNIVMAAYGRTTSDRVFIFDDPQIAKALEVLPQARVLAQAFRVRSQL
jgi:carboxyl-terminal processing protease